MGVFCAAKVLSVGMESRIATLSFQKESISRISIQSDIAISGFAGFMTTYLSAKITSNHNNSATDKYAIMTVLKFQSAVDAEEVASMETPYQLNAMQLRHCKGSEVLYGRHAMGLDVLEIDIVFKNGPKRRKVLELD
jgi:hypothetical protein